MSYQVWPATIFICWLLLAYLVWRADSIKVRLFLALLAIVLFAFNPLKFKESGFGEIEARKVQEFKVPPKTVVDFQSFEERQKQEMKSLKNQSEGMKDEIHN